MQIQTLKKIGLTEGEIRVYQALIYLGKSSTGPIMKKSKISSSKVYLILEKLIQKGLISFVTENNTKKFQTTNPDNIIDYLEKKQKEIEQTKTEALKLIVEINSKLGKQEEESAQVYKGYAGMKTAFKNILNELEDEEFLFFSLSDNEFTKKVKIFMDNFHALRESRKISAKGIFNEKFKKEFQHLSKRKFYKMKFSKLSMPSSMAIGKNRIILTQWDENPMAFEIISKRTAKKYKEFFFEIWNS